MFTWICPTCGREVPPAYTECPDCTAKDKAAAESNPTAPAASEPTAPAAVATPAAPPQQAYPPAPPVYQPPRPSAETRPPAYPPPYPAARRSPGGLPTWLLTIVFAFAFVGFGIAIYWGISHLRGQTSAAPSATVESPAAKPGAKPHPLQKYIEVSGVRILEDKKKNPIVKFMVTNHSGAEIADLGGNVTVWGRTQKSEEEAAGTFSFSNSNLGPYESKELTAPLTTKLKVYELPDWQNVSTDIQITSPPAL